MRERILTVVVPATHTESDVEEGPLPEGRCEIVLLVGVRHQGIVGSHHGDIQMNEVLEERRLVVARVASRELLVDVALDIPVGVDIARVVGLDAGSLNLLETPLRQIDVAGAKVAAKIHVLEPQSSSERSDLRAVVRGRVTDDLHLPVVLCVSNSGVAVAGNFPVGLGHRGSDRV